ncbi:MAG: DinB family protein, partial [Thermoanaerobaculia bacterium]|nr:DinB family protein [Thermoanaerobaculia bacterium]
EGPMSEPVVHGWMPAAAVFFRDPDGHLVELVADLAEPPRPDFVYRSLTEWRALDHDRPEPSTIEFRLADARALLRRTPELLRVWLDGLPERWLRQREGPGSWSAHEVVGHLVHGEKTDWIPRLQQILEGRGSEPFPPFDRFAMQRLTADVDTAQLLRELARLRSESLEALDGLTPEPDHLDDPGLHPELGPVTVRQLLATWTVHDQTHIAQIARVLAKQYRDEVGPWRAYLPLLDRPRG